MKWLLSPSDCTAASQWWLSTSPLAAACSPVVSVQTGKHGALMYLLINNCTTLYYWNNFKDTWLSYTELHGWIHRWKVTCQYKGRDHTFQSVLQVKPAIFVTFQPITFHLSAVMQEVSNVFVGRCPQETECWTTAGVVMFFSPTVIGRLCETTWRQVCSTLNILCTNNICPPNHEFHFYCRRLVTLYFTENTYANFLFFLYQPANIQENTE